jgi:hypothetical protein
VSTTDRASIGHRCSLARKSLGAAAPPHAEGDGAAAVKARPASGRPSAAASHHHQAAAGAPRSSRAAGRSSILGGSSKFPAHAPAAGASSSNPTGRQGSASGHRPAAAGAGRAVSVPRAAAADPGASAAAAAPGGRAMSVSRSSTSSAAGDATCRRASTAAGMAAAAPSAKAASARRASASLVGVGAHHAGGVAPVVASSAAPGKQASAAKQQQQGVAGKDRSPRSLATTPVAAGASSSSSQQHEQRSAPTPKPAAAGRAQTPERVPTRTSRAAEQQQVAAQDHVQPDRATPVRTALADHCAATPARSTPGADASTLLAGAAATPPTAGRAFTALVTPGGASWPAGVPAGSLVPYSLTPPTGGRVCARTGGSISSTCSIEAVPAVPHASFSSSGGMATAGVDMDSTHSPAPATHGGGAASAVERSRSTTPDLAGPQHSGISPAARTRSSSRTPPQPQMAQRDGSGHAVAPRASPAAAFGSPAVASMRAWTPLQASAGFDDADCTPMSAATTHRTRTPSRCPDTAAQHAQLAAQLQVRLCSLRACR